MSISRDFIRFAAVGATGTAVQYAVLWAGVSFFSVSATIASAIGYALGSVLNYLFNYLFTFKSGKSHVEAATKYYAVLAIGLCINIGLMVLFTRHMSLNYWLAQIATTGIGLVWNFSGSKWWAFKPVNT